MKSTTHLFTMSALVISLSLTAQTKLNYNHTLSNPTYLFPELSGWHGGMQAHLGYRNQWPGIPSTYVNYTAGVDAYASKLHSGVSLIANHYRAASGVAIVSSVDMSLAPKIQVNEKTILTPAISLQLGNVSIDWSQITYPSEPYFGFPSPGIGNPIRQNAGYLGIGAGIGIIQDKMFFVAHSESINEPDVSFYANTESRIPRTYQFMAGRNFEFGAFTLTPSLMYQHFGGFNTWGVSANAQYKSMYVGGRFTDGNTWAAAAGYEIKQRVRLSYAYDVSLSRLSTQTWGSHELMLRVWLFKDKAKKQFLTNLPLL